MHKLGLIGLGLVGTALAHRFHKAGYDVLGYDLLSEPRQALANAGSRAAANALEVAGQCDVIVLSLPDAHVVASVIAQIEPALRAGQLVIDTTTGEPLEAESLGAKLATRGVRFLDATIAGSSAQVHDGLVTVMAGGQADAFDAAHKIFACFAVRAFHVGPWGSGSRMKLVVNLVLGLNRAVLAEGLALGAALELDLCKTLEILRATPAYSKVMDTKGPKMLAEDFTPQARLSQHLKDVRLILEAAERTGTTLQLSLVHRELLERAEAAGYGELDNSAIIRAFRDLPGGKP